MPKKDDEDRLAHISSATQNKAIKLAQSAQKINFEVESLRFSSYRDGITFIFTNSFSCVIIYVQPSGYLGELRTIKDSVAHVEPFAIKNIRGLLRKLQSLSYKDYDLYMKGAHPKDSEREEVRKLVNELLQDGE